ncbi:MAG: ABC transporter ATP-binding protein [Rhodospirillaceae bacterium]|nr:ABC transporter ATP-binding protein [Rhodospirillaceae bacterium]
MSDLRLSGVAKRYGRVQALDGVDLEIAAGEFFCLLGPSAAGKTTTLRAIAGLERIDAGTIRFAGEDITTKPVQKREMAMIFQTFALYPHLTVADNLAYPLREARVPTPEIRKRVAAMAEMLRIGHTLDRKPGTLSGGEQQRVAIGRALIRRPRLLLLDEPLTNLDAKLRHDTRAEFKRLHRELGTTMLYATPDQLEALTMGQRVGVIRQGRIVQVGTPRELYAAPRDRFVAGLVGAPAMNLVPATRRAEAGGETVLHLPFGELRGGPWARALADFPDGDLIFGFRPHDVIPAEPGTAGPTFRARVHLTEPLGDITVLDLEAGSTVFKMVLPHERALRYAVGDELDIAIAVANTHLFSRETGVAIR